MKIGIDIMGGDYAPESTILGSILAQKELPDYVELVCFGDRHLIECTSREAGFDPGRFSIVHTDEIIEMGEFPSKAYSKKPDSSIVKAFHLLKADEIQGFASAGNTGAMLVGAMQTIKLIPGIIRPAIAATIPNLNGSPNIILDVGINPDCKPDVLFQYAILGSLYARNVHSIQNPKVGLLNIGSEEEKGNLLTKATFQMMKDTEDFEFIGNIEGNDIYNYDKVDVIVCDGFVGNVVLKQAESIYDLIKHRGIEDDLLNRFNYENYGGTPVLGVNKPVMIGHGISGPVAIKNMIIHTLEFIEANLSEKIKQHFM